MRVEVKNGELVKEAYLKKTNPNGIVRPDANTVHVVYGGRVSKMRNIVDNYMYEQKA
ncbi:hypothetical protein [Halolactibacillus sp. JCM 19043]|uniref:hypothetical protein n=1 Tax=Halolactibacillus sp. JCM 19043 TaxID=1460638 RepID=UPI001E3154AF|nr:hypothetical protein [Halolactibacillus sp. JCM 19043]